MPNFDTGVSRFIKGVAEVENFFPVDHRGNADLSCSQCKFYRISTRRCNLTGDLINYPDKYLGATCPLYFPDGAN